MTKYIVQSGNVKNFPKKLKVYNEEIFKDFYKKNKKVKVLMCFFAMPRERWEEKFESYKKNLLRDINLNLEIEMALPTNFIKQCQDADIIYISGGDDELLQYRFSKFDIPKIWNGKIITTSSAGSDYLAESFWTCDWRENMKGSGILSIKFIPHFKSKTYDKNDPRGKIDWEKAYKELEKYGNKKTPIYALEEGDFVVFEK